MAVSAKVASAYIDLVARTEAFQKAMDDATGMIRKFSAQTRAEMQESRAAIAMLGEAIGVHVPRHLQAVINKLPGVSAAMNAAFVATPILLAGKIIFETGEKLDEFVRKNEEVAKKNEEAWKKYQESGKATIAELDLANIKLDNQIAKLEHKPENKFAEAIAETRVETIKLQEQLGTAIEKAQELLKTSNATFLAKVFDHASGNGYEQTMMEQHRIHMAEALTMQDELNESVRFHNSLITRQNELYAMSGHGLTNKDGWEHYTDASGQDHRVALGVGGNFTPELNAVKELLDRSNVEQVIISGTMTESTKRAKQEDLQAANTAADAAKKADRDFLEDRKRRLVELEDVDNMTLQSQRDFWAEMAKVAPSAGARALMEQQANIAQRDMIKRQTIKLPMEKDVAGRIENASDKEFWEDLSRTSKRAEETFRAATVQIEGDERLKEIQVELLVKQGRLSQVDAALADRVIHQMAARQWQSAADTADMAGAGPNAAESAKHNSQLNIQAIIDAQATLDATWHGMADSVFDEIVRKSRETTQQIKQIAEQFLDGMNLELAKGMTGHGMDFGKIFDQASQQLSKTALEKIEGMFVGDMKLGTKGNPMHIVDDNAIPGFGGGSSSGVAATASKGLLGILNDSNWASSLFGGRLFGSGSFFGGGHALGGAVAAGIPIDVGELGREKFTPMVPGRITPHNQISNGGNTWNVDARGTDPALTQANFARALQATHARAVGDASRAMMERSRRTPQ